MEINFTLSALYYSNTAGLLQQTHWVPCSATARG